MKLSAIAICPYCGYKTHLTVFGSDPSSQVVRCGSTLCPKRFVVNVTVSATAHVFKIEGQEGQT